MAEPLRRIPVGLTDDERQKIQAAMDKIGERSMGAYLRKAALKEARGE